MRLGNIQPGIFHTPYIPLQWVYHIGQDNPLPTWLDQLKLWDFEAWRIEQKENAYMALTTLQEETKRKEQARSELLQSVSRLEGSMSATSKVEQGHLFDLLMIVRAVIEQR